MKIPGIVVSMMVLIVSISVVNLVHAGETDTRKEIRAAKSKPTIRGGIVYKNYCVLCHGERGDGMARATKLYGQGNLVIKARDDDYYQQIIRYGGSSVGLSRYMPAWEEELSEEQINDVIDYISIVNDPVERGRVVFMTSCILCHGVKANGKGRASVMYDPRPADLTRSDKNDSYKKMIITMGGEAMGRSKVMPQWGLQLKEQEIDDVIEYLRTILVKPLK